jgi:hypothetical protein
MAEDIVYLHYTSPFSYEEQDWMIMSVDDEMDDEIDNDYDLIIFPY